VCSSFRDFVPESFSGDFDLEKLFHDPVLILTLILKTGANGGEVVPEILDLKANCPLVTCFSTLQDRINACEEI